MFMRVSRGIFFCGFRVKIGERVQPPFSGCFKKFIRVFKDTARAGFSNFIAFQAFLLSFTFTFARCGACGAVRPVRIGARDLRGACGACLPASGATCTCSGAHTKTPKNSRCAGIFDPPPCRKKVVSGTGAAAPSRHTTRTLLSSDIFLYLCTIKHYYYGKFQ